VGDEVAAPIRPPAGAADGPEDVGHAGPAQLGDLVDPARGVSVHHDLQQVAVGDQVRVRRAQPRRVVLAVRVEGSLVEHLLERQPDLVRRPAEHLQEQRQLGAERAHDVGLGDPRLASHRVGAGAVVAAPGEGSSGRLEQLFAAFLGGHPGGAGGGVGIHG
jgi:hypothetical protein